MLPVVVQHRIQQHFTEGEVAQALCQGSSKIQYKASWHPMSLGGEYVHAKVLVISMRIRHPESYKQVSS